MKLILAFATVLSLCSCSEKVENQSPAPSIQAAPASSAPVAQNAVPTQVPDMKSCSNIPGYTSEIELKPIPSQKTNMLFVTFIGRHPPNAEIDKILRACLSAASKLDSKWPILGNALLRATPKSDPDYDDNIRIYEPLEYISFDPSDNSIAVRKMRFSK